jgi:hypothetical protein
MLMDSLALRKAGIFYAFQDRPQRMPAFRDEPQQFGVSR